MGNETLSRRLGATIAVAILIMAVAIPLTAMGKSEKITVCHAAGQDGTEQFVTLELPPQAVYGNGGHLQDNGTPLAGHESDYLGPCVDDSTTTTDGTNTTLDSVAGSTSTTVFEETTSTEGETEVAPFVETTSTTVAGDTTTPTTDDIEIAASTAQVEEGRDVEPEVGAIEESVPRDGTPAEDVDSAVLPFTGVDRGLIVPASLMLCFGAIALFVTGGITAQQGAHMAAEAEGFGLGLHRGRHESAG